MSKRTFHFINNPNITQKKYDDSIGYSYQFHIEDYDIDSQDTFEGDVLLLAFPIDGLQNIDNLLYHFKVNDNSYYFHKQLKELISVPEKHSDENGKGALDFQTYFHDVPYSVISGHEKAIVVMALHLLDKYNDKGQRNYNLLGYIHANKQMARVNTGEFETVYYYNLLRISDQAVNGQHIYRRKKLFMLFFSILNKIVDLHKVNFIYAAMGRDNKAINEGLNKSAVLAGHHYDRIPVKMNTHHNAIYGSKSNSKKIVDITHDEEKLKVFYELMHQSLSNYMFYYIHSFEEFKRMVEKVTAYSKSSRVWVWEENNEIVAGCFAINWGDYFTMDLLNAKGLFYLIEYFEVAKRNLFPILYFGGEKYFSKLIKGVAHHYYKNHKCQITLLQSYDGDPLAKVKKSLLVDEMYFFMISRNKKMLDEFMERSKDANGHIRLFTDQPII